MTVATHTARGTAVYDELVRAGITHLVWLPDSETHFLHQVLVDRTEIEILQVCREGEAFALCAGLHLGGRRPALLIENQGMFDSGNVLKWAVNVGIPILMLVGYLHFASRRDTAGGRFIDGARDYTESFLDAFGVEHRLLDTDDMTPVGAMCAAAAANQRPAAVLVASADHYHPGT
ncbi:hypothetical protein PSU4_60030 [Pseudonocardia sulfidoxydans NBRC 16205]|uniref:Thiamine pyrophosphate enzyme N-terminal TPP-binding domain-containing protein n=1 Tax=Pseudonocardia sulfidoxydans NBRC 16205 TaxID=1223511 RepID=A0A511DQI6_9PSEU|nr:thiamine pyrophosphate-binding protein [Pseudonocardia sulfidoxydans]GEL27049.1 hypothetical protein PSU4_60030 [Pseudonocardia sulfidoxydans NBRC 16205]